MLGLRCAGEARKLLETSPNPCGKANTLPVAEGQTCDSIAAEIKRAVEEIEQLNPDKCANLKAGDILCIPPVTTASEDPPAADNKEGL